MAVHGAVQSLVGVAQPFLDEFSAGEGVAGVLHQHAQEVELGGRELHRLAVHLHLVPVQVHEQPTDLQDAGRREIVGGTAQHRPRAGHDLTGVEGLGDVIVGTQFQAEDAVGVLDAGREHDDGQVGQGGVAAHDAGDVPAVAAGQHQVEHHQVRPLTADEGQGHLALVGDEDLVAGLFQIRPH